MTTTPTTDTADAPARPLLRATLGVDATTPSAEVFADAVLYRNDYDSRHRPAYFYAKHNYYNADKIDSLFAMSIVGPEQAVRAVGASFASEEYAERRKRLFLHHEDGTITRLRWAAPVWHHVTKAIGHGLVHMVALPPAATVEESPTLPITQIVLPRPSQYAADPTLAVYTAIYERLLISHSTPLIPIGVPGQCDAELCAAAEWIRTLGTALEAEAAFKPLDQPEGLEHPEWRGAVLLTMSTRNLDRIVSSLVECGDLVIPETTNEVFHAAAPAI